MYLKNSWIIWICNITGTEATDKPRNNFANFLDDLGVELDSVEFLTVKPGKFLKFEPTLITLKKYLKLW